MWGKYLLNMCFVRYLRFSSTMINLNYKEKMFGHLVNNENKICNNNCVRHIIGCYKNKLEDLIDNYSGDIEFVNENVQKLVLSSRPDEFNKLPPKCSACGCILQTKRDTELGYLPEAKFLDCVKEDSLQKISCYNCFQLRSYNKGSGLRLNNSEVLNQLAHLKQQPALILYIVDLFDIEGTQIENLLETIGRHKRIIIVGNKVDKLPQDNKKASKQLEHMKDILKRKCYEHSLPKDCNFRDICMVSAKSGFGMLSLIEKITKHRNVNMDIYLVGCANTGKSTLYNLLINLLNVHKNEELPPQGIVHHLPGTTASLIRHHISMRRMKRLHRRLSNDPWKEDVEFTFDEEFINDIQGKIPLEPEVLQIDETNKEHSLKSTSCEVEIVEFDYKKEQKQCYLYDTPGVFNNSQIIKHFHSSEINLLSPQKWIIPRTYLVKPGNSLFIGGFARLDYTDIFRPKVQGDEIIAQAGDTMFDDLDVSAHSIFVTVMMSPNIPVHATFTENEEESVEEKYERLFVNNILQIPDGGKERLKTFPPLLSRDYTVVGKNRNINACDLAIHGIGWLSVAAISEGLVNLTLSTPNGEGQSFRETPLLPYSVRNKEGRGVIYRGHLNRNMYGHTRKRSRQFVRLFERQNQPTYLWKTRIREKLKIDREHVKENRRLQRLKDGVTLGKMKRLRDKEETFQKLEEAQVKRLLEQF